MDVDLGVGRHIDIDDRFQLGDVQPARRHVGRHQHRTTAVGELDQHLVAFPLFQFAMQRQGMETLGAQHLQQVAALLPGIAEGQAADRAEVVEQAGDGRQPILVRHFVETLANLVALVALQQLHLARLVEELAGQFFNAFRVGGGKQQGLALVRALLRHEHHVVEETHVEHPVGLVEHQGIERIQIQAAALQVIQDAARRAHHDVGAMLQAGHLRSHGGAADQGEHLDVVLGARQATDLLGHLIGQLAGRTQHHRLHHEAARIQIRQQGQREGRRLAATSLRLGDQVVPRQGERQAGRLDRRHAVVTKAAQIYKHGGRQRQLLEGEINGNVSHSWIDW